VGEEEGRGGGGAAGGAFHPGGGGARGGRQIDFVDDREVGAGDAGAALARNLLALGDVDDVDRRVDQLGAERGRQVVTAALDQQELERRELLLELAHRLQIGRRVFADRRVGT